MKIYSGPESHDQPEHQTAQGWMATNLALPGLGSLIAGRKVGFIQLALCLVGFGLTLVCGLQMVSWSLAHWSEYHNPNADMDPFQPLRDLWVHARWPLLGIAMFSCAWVWSFVTSRSLLSQSKRGQADGQSISKK